MPQTIRSAYRFFHANAGYVVGRRALSALALARAECEARDRNLLVRWEWDDLPCDHEPRCKGAPEWAALYVEGSRHPLASLGGICGADATYRRVVAAELALEALAALRAEECAPLGTEE